MSGDLLVSIPVIVSVNGKGIVHKQINTKERNTDSESMFHGMDKDFYRSLVVSDYHALLVFCRKQTIDSISEQLLRNKIHILDLAIGLSVAVNFFKDHSIDQSYIGHGFCYSNGSIVDSKEEMVEVEFFGNRVDNNLLLPYIIAYQCFASEMVDPSLDLPAQILSSRKSFKASRRNFPIFAASTLLLLILLAFSTSVRESSQSRLSQIHQIQGAKKMQMAKEQEKRGKNEEIRREANLLNSYFDNYTMVLDRIGLTMPNSISLKSVSINPVLSKFTKNQEVIIKNRCLIVKGETKNTNDVSNWINALNEEQWVDRLTISSYVLTENVLHFDFEIVLKDV
jgi:hypothetical protein